MLGRVECRFIHAPWWLQPGVTTPWLLGVLWLPTFHFGYIAWFWVPQISAGLCQPTPQNYPTDDSSR